MRSDCFCLQEYHIEVVVIVNKVVWTTHFKQDLRQCDYKGHCDFVLLCKLDQSDITEQPDIKELPQNSILVLTPVKPKVQQSVLDLTKEIDKKER